MDGTEFWKGLCMYAVGLCMFWAFNSYGTLKIELRQSQTFNKDMEFIPFNPRDFVRRNLLPKH